MNSFETLFVEKKATINVRAVLDEAVEVSSQYSPNRYRAHAVNALASFTEGGGWRLRIDVDSQRMNKNGSVHASDRSSASLSHDDMFELIWSWLPELETLLVEAGMSDDDAECLCFFSDGPPEEWPKLAIKGEVARRRGTVIADEVVTDSFIEDFRSFMQENEMANFTPGDYVTVLRIV